MSSSAISQLKYLDISIEFSKERFYGYTREAPDNLMWAIQSIHFNFEQIERRITLRTLGLRLLVEKEESSLVGKETVDDGEPDT